MKLVSFLKEAFGDQSGPINRHLRQIPWVPRVGGVRTVYLRGYRPNKKAEGTLFDPSMSGFVFSFNNDTKPTTRYSKRICGIS